MITAIVAFAVSGIGLGQRPSPEELVSQMLSHYYGANTLTGNLHYLQSANDSDGKTYSMRGETTLQFEKPNKLYILQTTDKRGSTPGRIVSDGVRFLYGLPQDTRGAASTLGTASQANSELVENIVQFDEDKNANVPMTLAQVYGIGGAGLPLHPDVPLDIAISRIEDLKAFKDELATVTDMGDDKVDGQSVRVVGGDWRAYADAPVSGTYALAITDKGDLVRYVLKEKVADAGTAADGSIIRTPVVDVTTTWDVDLKVNAPVDEKLFQDKALAVQNGTGKG